MPDIRADDLDGAVAWAKAKGQISPEEAEILANQLGDRSVDLGPALAKAGVKVARMSRADRLKKANLAALAAKRSR